jgi:hypothetical protein
MDLRPELLPPQPSGDRLRELRGEIERIAALLERHPRAGAEAVRAFNESTGHAYDACDFTYYRSAGDLEEFALEAARPARPRVADVTRAELVEIVRRLMSDAGCDAGYYVLLFATNVPRPGAGDPLPHLADCLQNASAAELVDEALGSGRRTAR